MKSNLFNYLQSFYSVAAWLMPQNFIQCLLRGKFLKKTKSRGIYIMNVHYYISTNIK